MWSWCRVAVLALACAAAGGAAAGGGPAVRLWAGGALEYEVTTGAAAGEAARGGPEAGWLLAGRLRVRPLACAAASPDADHVSEALLQFQLTEMALQWRGAGARAQWAVRPSAWDAAAAREPFHALWRRGALTPLLPPAAAPHLALYQRALLSLFQFQIMDGERNETDASGDCAVLYETLSPTEFRKIKTRCTWAGAEGDDSARVESRRVARYTLAADGAALAAVAAEETHAAGAAGARVRLRVWTRLQLARAEGGACPPALAAARAALPPHHAEASLAPLRTQMEEEEEWEAWEGARDEWWAAAGGAAGAVRAAAAAADDAADAARALLALRPALRAASARQLQAALALINDTDSLTRAMRVVGGLGTAASVEAGAAALALGEEALAPPAAAFLAAAALAPRAAPAAARRLLALAARARHPAVRDAALLAGAGMSARCADEGVGAEARAAAARGLARCGAGAGAGACRALHAAALGCTRRADAAPPLIDLLQQALRDNDAEAGVAAVRALEAVPVRAARGAVGALLAAAAAPRAPFPLRAAALDLALRRAGAAAGAAAGTARALHGQRSAAARELRRLLAARLHALAPRCPPAARLLRALLADPQLGSWLARADLLAGTSMVMSREAGWAAGGARAEVDAAAAARGGLLRRHLVRLLLRPDAAAAAGDDDAACQEPEVAFSVEVWTRGLDALAGAAGEGEGEGEDAGEDEGEGAAAGVQLAVGGAALPPLTLFSSQTELMGHIWSGAGSQPTEVVRALAPLESGVAAVPTLGAGAGRLRWGAAAALALHASASVSLWARSGAARLHLRAAAAARASARLPPPAPAAARAAAAAPFHLSIAADLDFYDGAALCVRCAAAPPPARAAARAAAALPPGPRAVRRRAARARRPPPRTLALGAPNDRVCRAMPAAADDDDAL